MKISEFLLLLNSQLSRLYDSGETQAIIKIYLEERLKVQLSSLNDLRHIDLPLHEETQMLLEAAELAKGRPLQQVLGYQWFHGRNFRVNKHVLIPRPETEELVAMIIEDNNVKDLKVIDIGTGSGCIPITLKLSWPMATVTATDISLPALETARTNAEMLHADVQFIHDDILKTNIPEGKKFDLIVSNPPYIPIGDANSLAKNVLTYEPALALFTPDEDPLVYYKSIISFSLSRLSDIGRLYLEINREFGPEVINLFKLAGYKNVLLRKDLSGNDRFIIASFCK